MLRIVVGRNKVHIYDEEGLKAPLSYEFDSLRLIFEDSVPPLRHIQLGAEFENGTQVLDDREKDESEKDLSPEELERLLFEEPVQPKRLGVADYVEEVLRKVGKPLTATQIARVITRVTDYEPGEKSAKDFKSLVSSIRSALTRYEVGKREDGRFIEVDEYRWWLADLKDEVADERKVSGKASAQTQETVNSGD